MAVLLWVGAIALFVAAVSLLGYESHAALTDEEPTISAITRRWRGASWKKRAFIMGACTIIGLSIQFLGFHFDWDSIG